MTDADSFLRFVLFQNTSNVKIDVVFSFLDTPFDLFNFLIYLTIKSLSILSGSDSILVEAISNEHMDKIKDRLRYTGIVVNTVVLFEDNSVSKVYIHQEGDGQKIEQFSLNIVTPKQRYRLQFGLNIVP